MNGLKFAFTLPYGASYYCTEIPFHVASAAPRAEKWKFVNTMRAQCLVSQGDLNCDLEPFPETWLNMGPAASGQDSPMPSAETPF